jgi:hypothetical protein
MNNASNIAETSEVEEHGFPRSLQDYIPAVTTWANRIRPSKKRRTSRRIDQAKHFIPAVSLIVGKIDARNQSVEQTSHKD